MRIIETDWVIVQVWELWYFFRFRTLNFLSSFLDRRSFNFDDFASMVEQMWFRSRGDKGPTMTVENEDG